MEPWLLAATLAAAMIAAWFLGFRWGHWGRNRWQDAPEGKLDDAALALVGLLLAFTFSMALNKYDRRRETLVADSNAIGDFYTCASLIPDPPRTKLQNLIREYAQLRLDLAERPSPEALAAALPRIDQMHGGMTELVREALAAGTPIAAPLTNTLNEVTSAHASRLAAVRDRLPAIIVVLLLLASALNAVLVGRQQGVAPLPSLAGTAAFMVIVTLTVWITLDLNQPGRGFIRISQEPLQRLLNTMRP